MIAASYSPTSGDLFYGTALQLRLRSFRWPMRACGLVMLLMFAAIVSRVKVTFTPMGAMLPIMGTLLLFGHYIIAAVGVCLAGHLSKGKTFTFTFTAERYRIEGPGSEAAVDWTNVMDVVSVRRGFLIRANKYMGIWIPRHAFQQPDGDSEFIALLKSVGVKVRAA